MLKIKEIRVKEKLKPEMTQVWSLKIWALWTLFPIISLLIVGGIVFWLSEGEPTRSSYWLLQQNGFVLLNNKLSVLPDWFWSNATLLGDALVLIPIISLIIPRWSKAFIAVLGTIPLAAFFSLLFKNLAQVPRPAAVLDLHSFNVIGRAISNHHSLPSGHSITIFAGVVAILAVLLPAPKNLNQWATVFFMLLFAAVICLSRVAVGAHWPLDIIFGMALGWIAGLSGAAVARRYSFNGHLSRRHCELLMISMLFWSGHLIYRAFLSPEHESILWLSALCGIISVVKLSKFRHQLSMSS